MTEKIKMELVVPATIATLRKLLQDQPLFAAWIFDDFPHFMAKFIPKHSDTTIPMILSQLFDDTGIKIIRREHGGILKTAAG